mmetsp:Transcript_38526/g.63144  ORF Transcript_38526/g.63144 Transcript_38526/m.63144 type:complete len:383 (-) Transcript_38526:52-1200(-)
MMVQSLTCIKRDTKWYTQLNIAILRQYIGDRITSGDQPASSKLFYFRAFAAVYCLLILLWNLSRFIRLNIAQFWLIFLSQWVAILSSAYFVSVSVFHRQVLRQVNSNTVRTTETVSAPSNQSAHADDIAATIKKFDLFYRATRWLFAASFAPSLSTALSNWLLNTNSETYVQKDDPDDIEKCLNSIHLHGVIFLLLFVDYFVSLSYLSYTSCVWPAALSVVYTIWTVIHYAAKISNPWHTRYIYIGLNWKYPLTASLMCVGMIASNLVIHVILAWIKYRFMLLKWTKLRDQKQAAAVQLSIEPPSVVRVQSVSQQATNAVDVIVVTDVDGAGTIPTDKMASQANVAIDASYESNVSEQCTTGSEPKDVNDSLEMTSNGMLTK